MQRTFDASVANLERICQKDRPEADASPTEFSEPWFAREILVEIGSVRILLASGEADRAAAVAVRVGVLAAHAGARYANFQLGIKRRTNTRTSGLARGEITHQNTLALYAEIRRLTKQYQSSYNPEISLVAFLSKRLRLGQSTIYRHLKYLNIPPR